LFILLQTKECPANANNYFDGSKPVNIDGKWCCYELIASGC